MGKRKQKNRIQPAAVVFVFTTEMIDLALRALARFEQPLHRADHGDEKVVFAEETVQRIKQKLRRMQEAAGTMGLTGFDYNEKIIIRQSMLLYAIELLDKPPGPQRDRELRQCRVIATSFTDEERDAHQSLT